jgi:hypothetical protein
MISYSALRDRYLSDRHAGGVAPRIADALAARWYGEDTLEVSYPAGVTVEMRRTTLQHGPARVAVVYREHAHP